MQRTALFLSILFGFTATAQAENPAWVGIWTAEPEWCQWAHLVGSHNPAPIQITQTEVNGLENFCDVKSVDEIQPGGAWTLALDCSSEGDTYSDQTLLMLEDNDTLWRWFGAGAPVRFTRCKE